jgi:methionine sulfoxide reductase heme-binding subunit
LTWGVFNSSPYSLCHRFEEIFINTASSKKGIKRIIYPLLVLISGLLPFIFLIINALTDQLGANPIDTIIRDTGLWTLFFLILTLCVRPLYQIMGWYHLRFNLRRMLGLYAFFYGSLHFFSYLGFEHFFDWPEIIEDILSHPPLTIGFIAFVLIIPLAITSNRIIRKRLGGQRWKRLHQLIYVIAIAGVLHFGLLVGAKADILMPIVYAMIVIALLFVRYPPIITWLKKKRDFFKKIV